MSIKARIEAIIYAAEEPVTLAQIFALTSEEARAELLRARRMRAGVAEVAPDETPEPEPEEEAAPAESAGHRSEFPSYEDADSEGAAPEETGPVDVNAEAPAADSVSSSTDAEKTAAIEPQVTEAELRTFVRTALEELMDDYLSPEHGIEVRQIAGGYRMATKPEQHDAVRAFARSLKPPIRLSLQALETLAVVAYKQPVTAPEISEVRGVDAGGVLGTLLERKLITTAGRKQVVGRPILYKTTREFLLRFGLKDVNELPSMEEFEKLAAESLGADLFSGQTGEAASGPAAAELAPEQVEADVAAAEMPAAVADSVAASEAPAEAGEAAAAESAEAPSEVNPEREATPEQTAARIAEVEAPLRDGARDGQVAQENAADSDFEDRIDL